MNNKLGVPYEGFAEFTKSAVYEGSVLLKNDEKMLPIKENEAVSVFGRCQIDYYRCGTGSGGNVDVLYKTNILDGLKKLKTDKLNNELANTYAEWIKNNPFDNGGGGWAAEPWAQKEMPLTDDIVKRARAFSEKAIYIIGRTAGEDKDNFDGEGGYRLTKTEIDVINTITAHFDKVAILLNVANIIDMSWVNNKSIKSIMYIWQGGMEGGNAVAEILCGKAYPSGRLPDTIIYNLSDHPATETFGNSVTAIYNEDIYVGYRYFETFMPEKVQYQFGYGINYTDFDIKTIRTALDGSEISLTVKVTNIGTEYLGKETVQVYFSAPQGKLGRPVKELVAFAKTNELMPGESTELAISFNVNDMAAYDDGGYTGNKSCYVLEEGDYEIFVGKDVKNNECVFTYNTTFTVTQKLEQALAPIQAFKRIKPVKSDKGYYDISYVDVPLEETSVGVRINNRLPQTIPQTGDKGYKLRDVYDKKVSMEDFIAQLSVADLAAIVRGEGMSSTKSTPGNASVFGGVSDSLFELGIPIASTADGPSGVRVAGGLHTTQIPIGTMLASTWNTDLMEEIHDMVGKELVRNNIDTLLGPGLNIHRHPLNGRNFEYFSEDPYLTGKFTLAAAKGINRNNVHATIKHLACNSQEYQRRFSDSVISERALREIYTKGFKIAVESGVVRSIMTCYNKINGRFGTVCYDLNTTIVRGEWGFKGIIMSDWWANINHPVNGGKDDNHDMQNMVRAQNDLYMVVHNNGAEINSGEDVTEESVKNGNLSIGELQRCAMNICSFLMECPAFFRPQEKETIRLFKSVAGSDNVHDVITTPRLPSDTPEFKAGAGAYTMLIRLMSPFQNTAQSTCEIKLNGEQMVTVQTQGTEGKWVTHKLMKVELENGNYKLEFNHTKPGLEFEWIEFKKIN